MKIFFFLLTFQLFIYTSYTQQNKSQDSLKNKSYKYLSNKIFEFYYDTIPLKTNLYTQAYLKKAKNDLDSSKIVESFFYLSELNEKKHYIALHYIDSAITFNKATNFQNFTPYLYIQKGKLLFNNQEYKKALDNFILAKKKVTFDPSDQPSLIISLDYNIGLLMLEIGNTKEALKIFKESYNYITSKNTIKEKYIEDYLEILHGLSISNLYIHELDAAAYFNKLENDEALYYKSIANYKRSRITEAFINYENENYQKALDSINKYLPLLEKVHLDSYSAISHLYKGKCYKKLNNLELAIYELKKADTIIQSRRKYNREVWETYDILYNYYKEKGDLNNELIYLERLINFESILFNNNTYLKNTLLTKYDTPKLIKEKERLIAKLKKNEHQKLNTIYFLLALIFVCSTISFYYYKKRKNDKKQFDILIKKGLSTPEKTDINEKQKLDIPESIVDDILKKMAVFEEQKGFLNADINLSSLSKTFETNSNYLSRIINFHKHKNFSSYVSDLRINYVIKALKEQPKLREYTIKAIAHEVGFKNYETFTNAFQKNAKIHPSYFLKQLRKQ